MLRHGARAARAARAHAGDRAAPAAPARRGNAAQRAADARPRFATIRRAPDRGFRGSRCRIRACTSARSCCVRCATSRPRRGFRAAGSRSGSGPPCAASASNAPVRTTSVSMKRPPRSLRSLPPGGRRSVPRGGPAVLDTAPTLAALAAPRGGRSVPRGDPAGLDTAPTLAALAAPRGEQVSPWGGPAGLDDGPHARCARCPPWGQVSPSGRPIGTDMDLERCRYIVVEGPIGAGKTSLARQLAEHLDAEMLLEQPEDNPFLSRFYDDMAALRAAHAAHVPVPARRPAARAGADRHVPPADRLRLPARQGSAVRAAQPDATTSTRCTRRSTST